MGLSEREAASLLWCQAGAGKPWPPEALVHAAFWAWVSLAPGFASASSEHELWVGLYTVLLATGFPSLSGVLSKGDP